MRCSRSCEFDLEGSFVIKLLRQRIESSRKLVGLIASVWFRGKFWKLITLKSTVLAVTSKNPIRAWTVSSMARNIIWKTFIYFKQFACGEISMFTDRLTPQPGLLFCSNNWSLYYIYFKRFAYGEISRFTDRLWMIAMSTAPISQRSWLQIPHRPFFFFFFFFFFPGLIFTTAYYYKDRFHIHLNEHSRHIRSF